MSKPKMYQLVGTLVLVFVLVLGWLLLLSPRMTSVDDINIERDSLLSGTDMARIKVADLQEMETELRSERKHAKALARWFPETSAQYEMLDQISDIAVDAGLKASDVKALSEVARTLPTPVLTPGGAAPEVDPTTGQPVAAPTEGLMAQTINIVAKGSHDQMVEFVHGLENMPRAYLINKVDIALTDSETNTSSATINGTLFLLPKPSMPKIAAAP
jgi:Tfp pilus assembly protein PilO